VKLLRTPVKGTLDASSQTAHAADDLIDLIAPIVAQGGVGTESELWDRIAEAYASVVGSPLDRAEPYNIAMASAILNLPSIRRLTHDELPRA
jgi:hypothetical protein